MTSGAALTCIWVSFSASHRISKAVHDIGTPLDVLEKIHVCILSSLSSLYMSFLCCYVLGRDRSILILRA